MAGKRAGFGNLRKLPSGRWQARYVVPGTLRSVNAPTAFETKADAEAWLATVRAISRATRGWPPSTTTTLRV